MRRGSISVFAALTLMLVASVLFTLLEASRVFEERRVLQCCTDTALESVFAGYDKPLWDDYQILARSVGCCRSFLDLSEIRQEFEECTKAAIDPEKDLFHLHSVNYLRAQLKGVSAIKYVLLTDGDGAAFQQSVISYMKQNVLKESVMALKDIYDRQKNYKAEDVDSAVSGAREDMKKAKAEQKQNGKAQKGKRAAKKQKKKIKDNPLKAYATMQKTGILALVLPEDAKVSGGRADLGKMASSRTLERGNDQVSGASGVYEKFLIQLYYARHFSDYCSPNTGGGLAYEREYLLGGCDTDEKNLKSCVGKILLLREAVNLAAIYADGTKNAAVHSAATVLAGWTLTPPVVEAVAVGLAAAWAFAESILDLRTLMDGGRVPLMKTPEQWTSDLLHLSECASKDFKAIESDSGLCYSDFVNLLLYTKGSQDMAIRAIDVIETNLRVKEGYENFQADHMLLSVSVCAEYEFQENFLTPVTVRNLSGSRFAWQAFSSYSYLKAGG